MIEYRIVWRWTESTRDKVKIYKTEKHARAFFERVTSNGGHYEPPRDEWERGVVLQLSFARFETREVQPWLPTGTWVHREST